MPTFSRSHNVKTAQHTISVEYDFTKDGGVNGTVIRMNAKLPVGMILFTHRQNLIDIAGAATATMTFSCGATPIDAWGNLQFVGNRFLVLASNIPAYQELTLTMTGVGDFTAGKFIYSITYQQQQIR